MTAFDDYQYATAAPHDPIEEIFPDVFLVRGSMRMVPLMQISRNMVVTRNAGRLTLVNPIRLSKHGEKSLEALGTVRHVVRLGCYHGIDDPYCVTRFDAEFWCQKGSEHYPKPPPDHLLEEGAPLPVPKATLFVFRETTLPECALLIPVGGGLLVTCDSVQHYGDWRFCSLAARLVMRLMGFSRTTLVGPLWKKYMTPQGGSIRPDFNRLLELDFEHLVSAHGALLRTNARAGVRAAVDRAYASE